jgi:predicted ATPase
MKGLGEPVELFEACDEGAVAAPPPDSDKVYRVVRVGERWLPVAQMPNNLPAQATSFIGRERELNEIEALLGQARLVTLLGMGGLGKTRLSLQVAAELMPQYPDGAWFVDLTAVRDAARVVDETARVLGVAEEPGRPPLQSLCAHLKSRRLLLILDNCEQVIEPAAELAAAILNTAPQVRIVASSREALRVPGEQAYPILPLPVPARNEGVQALTQSTAVRLFVERAKAQKPAFALDEHEAPAVAELVARLEGIPLALELAAARVRALSVVDINLRLKDRFRLLAGGDRTLQKRQQTLRSLVDWSYDLLNDTEKCLLDRLAVFVGGFDIAAAEAVCGAEPIDAMDVLDLIGSLVDKSLVMHEQREDGSRYRTLETIREYAREKLDQRGDDAAATAVRHCQHFFAFAKAARDGLRGAEQALWIGRLEADIGNLRAATAFSLAGRVDPFVAVKFAVALQTFWLLRGYASEGRGVVRAALSLPAVQSSELARAWALYVGAALAGGQGDHVEARDMLETCLSLRRGLGDPLEIAGTLSTLALYRLHNGDWAAAIQAEQEALQTFRSLDNRRGEAICLEHLGYIALYEGDDERARIALEQALAIGHEIANHELEGRSELLLGQIAFDAGDLDDAQTRFTASLAICRDAADRNGEANAQRWLGKVDLERNDAISARQRLGEALAAFEAFEMREEMVACLEDHAALALAQGAAESAAKLAGAAAQARGRLALSRTPRAEHQWQSFLTLLRSSTVSADCFEAAWCLGGRWETKDAVRAALSPSTPAPD